MDPDHGKCWGTDKVTMKDTFSTREPEESSRSASWDEYYAWGQYQIAKAVSFLNNDCKWIPGNVCLASAVVTQNLDQKPHAFDVLSEFDDHNEAAPEPLLQYEWLDVVSPNFVLNRSVKDNVLKLPLLVS